MYQNKCENKHTKKTKTKSNNLSTFDGQVKYFTKQITHIKFRIKSLVISCTTSFLFLIFPLRLLFLSSASSSIGAFSLVHLSCRISCRLFSELGFPKRDSSICEVWLTVRYCRDLPRFEPLEAELLEKETALPG